MSVDLALNLAIIYFRSSTGKLEVKSHANQNVVQDVGLVVEKLVIVGDFGFHTCLGFSQWGCTGIFLWMPTF